MMVTAKNCGFSRLAYCLNLPLNIKFKTNPNPRDKKTVTMPPCGKKYLGNPPTKDTIGKTANAIKS